MGNKNLNIDNHGNDMNIDMNDDDQNMIWHYVIRSCVYVDDSTLVFNASTYTLVILSFFVKNHHMIPTTLLTCSTLLFVSWHFRIEWYNLAMKIGLMHNIF